MNVALIGASQKPDRFAYKALKKLQAHGHKVFPVNPRLAEIEGERVWPGLAELPEKIDTVTLYLSAENLKPYEGPLLALKPKRVIFNPGTESPALETVLQNAGIQTMHDCTLMMLDGHRF